MRNLGPLNCNNCRQQPRPARPREAPPPQTIQPVPEPPPRAPLPTAATASVGPAPHRVRVQFCVHRGWLHLGRPVGVASTASHWCVARPWRCADARPRRGGGLVEVSDPLFPSLACLPFVFSCVHFVVAFFSLAPPLLSVRLWCQRVHHGSFPRRSCCGGAATNTAAAGSTPPGSRDGRPVGSPVGAATATVRASATVKGRAWPPVGVRGGRPWGRQLC